MDLDFIKSHRTDDVRQLILQAHRYPGIDVPASVVQISAWQTARRKLPSWAATDGIIYPQHLSMEQCSSEATALYKAQLVGDGGGSFCDLTAGFCVDAAMIGRRFKHVTVVERQEELCRIASNNLPLLGVESPNVVCGDATEVLRTLPHHDLLFLDPARRNQNGGKTVAISDCTPDVSAIAEELLRRADRVLVKLSPMIDITMLLRTLPCITAIHVVGVDGECKEVIADMASTCTTEGDDTYSRVLASGGGVRVVCANIHCDNTVTTFVTGIEAESAAQCIIAEAPLAYLYEPNATIMKAGCFRSLSAAFDVQKLHPSSHLFTSDTLVADFPGRIFSVEGVGSFNKKELKAFLSGMERANITVRNFPMSVPDLRKRLKLKEGGTDYIFATTLSDGRKVLIKALKV